ncbi:unannotated protein [freshwater metagenome]|uniref:Unannotated protein n=1 Tax=freshwater metagenome TaxID=449393 RepID=A0A6J7E6F5_9ZZZZ|nr:2-succinyl-5-enolpyruvyl-6-hydroxy-3-cyclohexene-1-carboxylic-acid synthase [Actinomycetota bacterium]
MSPAHTPAPVTGNLPEDTAATFCATLIDEWIHHGVRHAVVAPGSRSTPMALALTDRPELTVHVVHDERAASFVALGIGLHGVPAILLCTSGTAAAHFHGAVIEAHQSAVPMIVCTADRPPELRDVGAPQTIDQTKLYGNSVRWFHDPGVASEAAAHTWRSLAAHCFASSTGAWPGPVHLNLPFREPLVGHAGPLPLRLAAPDRRAAINAVASLDAGSLADLAALLGHRRGVIVAGRGCGDAAGVVELAVASGWPVIADSRSGLGHHHGPVVRSADQILRHAAFAAQHLPDVVVRLGEPPASKVLNQWLSGSGAAQVQVTSVPVWTDADGVITHRVVADPAAVCRSLAAVLSFGASDWADEWLVAEGRAQMAVTAALGDDAHTILTEPLVARSVGSLLPGGAQLVVSSSMPIRDVEWFGLIAEGVTVHSNRGANGIDGVIATAIGVAASTQSPTALLIGDVAFLHDSAALVGLAARNLDLRIVLIDNDGGGIFSFLPQAASLAGGRFEQLFGTPHNTNLVALAAAHGLSVTAVSTLHDLGQALSAVGPHVIHVRSERAENVVVHQRITDAVVASLDS